MSGYLNRLKSFLRAVLHDLAGLRTGTVCARTYIRQETSCRELGPDEEKAMHLWFEEMSKRMESLSEQASRFPTFPPAAPTE